jgi:hypothetical protein
MPELTFDILHGSWKGNDYPSVSITKVAIGLGTPVAFVFMTHMNVDFDGAPNAYGPPEKSPLDSLADAGRYGGNGYYGLIALSPAEADAHKLKIDKRFPDVKGRCPIIQQSGPYAGYFVSTTSKRNPGGSDSRFEQSHYLDSSSVAYCALSYGLASKGVGDGDFGIALRHDTFNQTSFSFLGGEGHGKGSAGAGAVGECSYKVFLDIGGAPKTSAQKYANNNFPTSFIVFPGSNASQLLKISLAEDAEDFAVFLALQAQVDGSARGHSGLPAFRRYVAGGRKIRPPRYESIAIALRPYGYTPGLSAVGGAVSSFATAVSKFVP